MATLHENIDSINDETTPEELKEKLKDIKSGADELHGSNKQLYSRTKKAEGFVQKDGKWLKVEKKPDPKPEKKPDKQKQSDEQTNERLDKMALTTEGITHKDDIKIVLDEAKRLKLPVEEVKDMEHIKTKLKDSKDQREGEDGMPEGSGSKGNSGNKTSVDHWVDKKDKDGNYITPDDLELAEKVINKRINKQEKQGKFADIRT